MIGGELRFDIAAWSAFAHLPSGRQVDRESVAYSISDEAGHVTIRFDKAWAHTLFGQQLIIDAASAFGIGDVQGELVVETVSSGERHRDVGRFDTMFWFGRSMCVRSAVVIRPAVLRLEGSGKEQRLTIETPPLDGSVSVQLEPSALCRCGGWLPDGRPWCASEKRVVP